jgi:hypothetical protein
LFEQYAGRIFSHPEGEKLLTAMLELGNVLSYGLSSFLKKFFMFSAMNMNNVLQNSGKAIAVFKEIIQLDSSDPLVECEPMYLNSN